MSWLKAAAQQTELIVMGFIQDAQTMFPFQTNPYYIIPTDIARVTLSYLNNYYSNDGVHKWEIVDEQMVDTMLNAKCGDIFISEQFEMARLNWRLEIYPNGLNIDTDGFFVIHLRLLSLPAMIDKVEFNRIFRVIQNMSGSCYIGIVSEGEYEYWTTKCPLKELIDMKCKTLTVQVEIQINKLILKQSVSDLKIISNETVDITMKQQLMYKIEGKAIDIFKKSMNCKEMCGDVVNNMWCFGVSPDGAEQGHQGYIEPFVSLCKLPTNAISLLIKYQICCIETNIAFEEIITLNSERCSRGSSYFMKLIDIQNLNSITFTSNIEILDIKKEINNLEIFDQAKITYLLSNK